MIKSKYKLPEEVKILATPLERNYIMKTTKPLKVSFENDIYSLTRITGSNLREIYYYCHRNHLTIVEGTYNILHGYIVEAEKPNQRVRVLRKAIRQIDGWNIIKVDPTQKMNWITYEKISK